MKHFLIKSLCQLCTCNFDNKLISFALHHTVLTQCKHYLFIRKLIDKWWPYKLMDSPTNYYHHLSIHSTWERDSCPLFYPSTNF